MTTRSSSLCCSRCGSTLDFQTMMLSLNPYAIRCDGCDQKIRPNPVAITLAGLVLFALLWALWGQLAQLGFSYQQNLMAVVGLTLGFEYLLFEALRKGWIPSTLVASDDVNSDQPDSASLTTAKTDHSIETLGDRVLLPAIRLRQGIEGLKQSLLDKPEQQPVVEPLVGDLMLGYTLSSSDKDDLQNLYEEPNNLVTPAQIERFGLAATLTSALAATPVKASLRQQAERNALPILSTLLQSEDGKVTRLTCNDHLMAAGLLFSTLWDQIEQQVGTEVVIAVPHRDHIWYVPANDADAVQQLRNAVAAADFDDAHRLSRLLFVREEGEWEVFDD